MVNVLERSTVNERKSGSVSCSTKAKSFGSVIGFVIVLVNGILAALVDVGRGCLAPYMVETIDTCSNHFKQVRKIWGFYRIKIYSIFYIKK